MHPHNRCQTVWTALWTSGSASRHNNQQGKTHSYTEQLGKGSKNTTAEITVCTVPLHSSLTLSVCVFLCVYVTVGGLPRQAEACMVAQDRKSTTQANELVTGTAVLSAMNSKFSMNSDQHAETRDNHPSASNECNFLLASTQSALLIGEVSQYEPNELQISH